jgi:catechol 2,3-dioxygenase-like lactoylglutathione lyase family enzyme
MIRLRAAGRGLQEVTLSPHALATPSRRALLRLMGAGSLAWLLPRAAGAAGLPLVTTGVEHFGMTVHDQEAAARFYGRIFDPQLFQERDPPLRFYVKLGTGYLAIGGNTNVAPSIDHFCVLIDGLQPAEMRKTLEDAGVPLGPGALGLASDPDGLRLQMLAMPGGLARTVIPAFRISQDPALFQAIAPDHVTLGVSDLDKSAAHYRKLFGPEKSRTSKPARLWFEAARTKIALEQIGSGEHAAVRHISVRVASFDRGAAAGALKRAGVEVVASDEPQTIRFRDPNGFVMELRA